MSGFPSRDAIRVKVKKCEGLLAPEYSRFSVDPQITSFEVLQSLLSRAFDIKGEFSISYLAQDEEGRDVYLSMLSDWDLDAAFLGVSDPFLQLKVDLKPFEEGLEDWDLIPPSSDFASNSSAYSLQQCGLPERPSITDTILNHVEKTFTMMQRAFNLGDNLDSFKPVKQPMVDSEFHNYLDNDGRLVRPRELRLSVHQGGIDPSLRKVVWKHILNVYPCGLTAKERISYIKQKSNEYVKLRQTWQDVIADGQVTEEIQYVTNMVRKDVLRTDRTHKFYAGSDDNKNVVSLFNMLTTYALNHPSVSYCQGMSDLASPIFVTMKDEAHAYVCFCALMQRLKPSFQLDGKAMTLNFQQLTELLQYYDSPFFSYLKGQCADDLLFCYRWLLLELKREFAFDDALRMLEVLWSSIPPSPPSKELPLYEEPFSINRMRSPSPRFYSRENPYTKVRAIRKQNSASSFRSLTKDNSKGEENAESLPKDTESNESNNCDSVSSDVINTTAKFSSQQVNSKSNFMEVNGDDSQEYLPMTTSMTRELRMELENLNRQLPGSSFLQRSITVDSEDLDSPHSPDEIQVEARKYCYRQQSIDQSLEEDAPESWTSDDLSGVDQICRIGSAKKSKKRCSECARLNNKSDQVINATCCYTPDDRNGLEFDEKNKSLSDVPCNGEILENEELEDIGGCSCHLKSVIPIRLVHSPGIDTAVEQHGSDSSDSLSESFLEKLDDKHSIISTNCSEDYACSDATNFKEINMIDERIAKKRNQNSAASSNIDNSITDFCEETLEYSGKISKSSLPPPYELGGGNPFLLFLCLTLLLQHRDIIIKSHMDYNEMAMHFDKMVRKHNVHRVLHQARAIFREYLQMGWQENNTSVDPQV